MAIPKIKLKDIMDALKYIDENGVPFHNQSTKYELVTESGRKYPPKYVIAVADHLANDTDISADGFNAVETKNFLQGQGFDIQTKQEKFELTITADAVTSTDKRFTMSNLSLGDNYKPLDTLFKKADGTEIRRIFNKGERRNSNQTMPRLAFQIFEKQIASLPVEEREEFPTCRYTADSEYYKGIFLSVDEYKEHYHKSNTFEYMIYSYGNGRVFVIYSWNIFSTIIFVQECLKRFGEIGDQFVLIYREKEEVETIQTETEMAAQEELVQQFKGYRNPYSSMLIESKNIIFRGAPGTGKSYLAKEIAADIISDGYFDDYTLLSDEQRKQVEFVQFHPNYDYTDFVEGLRPKINEDGSMGFELHDGVFKRFVARARKNYEDSQKSREEIAKEVSANTMIEEYLDNLDLDSKEAGLQTLSGHKFYITSYDERHINVSIPDNETVDKLSISRDNIRKMIESGKKFSKVKDLTEFFGKKFGTQGYYYDFLFFMRFRQRNRGSPIPLLIR
ncbi:MAG: hypothetical protein LUD16_07275 [Lachnospiraceae bacterium]|nr:hypothetical protein [Lachnospiraceae bacterium]